ncbi:hypothetical protein [Thalassovita sp.]|uniref:hypothetical protein n=1 Tax=Thalassovita sp. TaxID=1979401 RepID=UPI0029DE7308|nr:hypothetical protein [Thalassovita sp.]
MKVTLDKREGVKNTDETYDVSQVTEAVDIVSQLDGSVRTLAYFERDDGASLMVGGGKKHFIVTLTAPGQDLTLANDEAVEGDLIEVCAGGQFGEYPAEIVCGVEQANKAVTSFFDGSEEELRWC